MLYYLFAKNCYLNLGKNHLILHCFNSYFNYLLQNPHSIYFRYYSYCFPTWLNSTCFRIIPFLKKNFHYSLAAFTITPQSKLYSPALENLNYLYLFFNQSLNSFFHYQIFLKLNKIYLFFNYFFLKTYTLSAYLF